MKGNKEEEELSMKLKKMLAGFMAVCMVATAVPVTALANENVNVAAIGNAEYTSIQAAVNDAKDGDEITVIADHTITWDGEAKVDDYATLVNVEGKTVTIDLNGKELYCEANMDDMLVGFFSTENNGHLILKDSDGDAEVKVDATSKVYALLVNYDETSAMTVEGGNYILNEASDSLVYSGGDGVTVNDGNFELGNVGEGENGKPWIFNVFGKDDNQIIANGGTFNADVNHQYWADEVYVPQDKALKMNDDTWTIVDAVAYVAENYWTYGEYDPRIRYVGYATLEEAIAAADDDGEDITLLADGEITSGTVNAKIERNGFDLEISGGTFYGNEDLKEYVADGCLVEDIEGGWKVVKPVAAIGDKTYTSIQAAVDAAEDGDIVTLLENIDLSAEDAVETTDKLPVLVLVEGKDITLDLNRKTLSVDHQSTTGRIYSVVHVADGAGLTVTGNGKINVDADDDTPKVAYLFWKRGTTGSLVIENGTYYMDNSEDSMLYTNGDEIVTINGGTFTLDAVGTGENGSPWIFNAQGKDDKKITVNGGTFNADINHQYWADEVYVPQDKALKVNDDTWTIVDAVAYVAENYWTYGEYDPRIRYVGYATLEEAIGAADDNGEDITLLADGKITSGTVNCEIIPNGYNLEITGGTFVSEPSDNFYLADCVVTGCTAERTKEDGTEWTIVPAAGSVATIGNVGYKTLAEAVAAAKDNDVIVLQKDNAENVTVSREVTFTLDKNNKEFTGSIVAGEGYSCTKDGDTYEFTEKGSSDTPSTSSNRKSSKKYSVEIEDMEDGTVKASSTRVKKGATVTLTVTPDKGYELDELVVLDSDGDEVELKDKGNGKFTFVMPRGGVEVEASFEEADEPVVDEPAEGKEKTTLVLTINQVIYQLNGEYKVNDVAPIIQKDRTFLPIRLVAETLGATVSWSEADQAVTIVKGDTTIVIYIGQAFALVNGEPVELDAPAFIANDRTYLPVRFVAENLGATVTWNDVENTVTIVAK